MVRQDRYAEDVPSDRLLHNCTYEKAVCAPKAGEIRFNGKQRLLSVVAFTPRVKISCMMGMM